MSTKTIAGPAVTPEAIDTLEILREKITPLARSMFFAIRAKPGAARAESNYQRDALEAVTWALEVGQSMPELYSVLGEITGSLVATVAREKGLTSEEVRETREISENRVSQLNGPFWSIARTIEVEGPEGILAEATAENATFAKVKKYAVDRTGEMAFDPKRGEVEITFTPRGTDHAVTFTVASAIKTREKHTALVTKAATVKADNATEWRKVVSHYRNENPAGMVDRRTNADRNREALEIGRAVMDKMSPAQMSELLK